MLSFRQKIFLTYILVFSIFLVLMPPLASLLVRRVVEKAMENRALELIAKIQTAPNDQVMIQRLKELKPLTFFRVSVINNERKVLYDSHTKKLLGTHFNQDIVVQHPEVLEALRTGSGYTEDYSDILSQKFAYTAVAFDFHGKKYVLRTAFPYRYVKELVDDFEIGFLLLALVVLGLFSLMTWFIIQYLTKPIQQIISAVELYKKDGKPPLSELQNIFEKIGSSEDVGRLLETLISLSERLQSEISKLRDERDEKEVILESLVEGVIATDQEMSITFANLAALKFLGMRKENLLKHSFQAIQQDKAYELVLNSTKERRPLVDALRLVQGNRVYFLDIIAIPKRDNRGIILVMLDKSEHYRILEMRKDFIANASHELKTPITIIHGFAETLYENPDLDKKIVREITEKIVRSCERMTLLIKDLLTLADIENIPSSRIQEFDLTELVRKVSDTTLHLFPTSEIHITTSKEGPVLIEADSDLIEMALTNLLQNAAKYSNPPAKISIKIFKSEENVTLEIADKGIGISQEDLGKIFERFYRVDKAKKVGGSGLGLSITDTIIRKHFGSISVSSELGKGTVFTLTLPIKHFISRSKLQDKN